MNNKTLIIVCLLSLNCIFQESTSMNIPKIKTINDAIKVFPATTDEIKKSVEEAINRAKDNLEKLYAIPQSARTFENTVQFLDNTVTEFSIKSNALSILEMACPDKELRDSAHENILAMQNFYIDYFSQNKKLYDAFKEYSDSADLSALNSEERYSVEESIKGFKRIGMHLPDETRDQIKNTLKELGEYELEFDKNIAQDNRFIEVDKNQLSGLTDQWINSKQQNEEGKYVLGIDYPTFNHVLENCSDESTRKALWAEYVNRGYPKNEEVLSKIISLRDKLAKLLGFNSYADLDIDSQMAGSVKKVDQFLDDVIKRCDEVANKEVKLFMQNLPHGVTLTEDKKFKPWDLGYTRNQYKKQYLTIDELLISEYFPMEHTLNALLDIYQDFFGIVFKKEAQKGFWHEDVEALSVYKDDKFLGYILLDLFPRENKYSHAAEVTIVPTFKPNKDEFYPALILVITNFQKATQDKPALLPRDEVKTFFHEFGHALHAILGATQLASNSGAHVKRDFVEMPSQMLEEWLWQPNFLKKASSHYKTKDQLPDELIEKILALKLFNPGEHNQRQIYISYISLNLFKEGSNKNIAQTVHDLHQKTMKHVYYPEDNHWYCSFGHLTGYGAKYYGYLWSKIYALDLFSRIKEAKFSPAIGQRYIDCVLSKGGSDDPMNLLQNFLDREPNADAFFKDLGLN